MTYRVIQWATGNVGRQAVRGVCAHPELELVGCWVHSDAKSGHDVGEICGVGKLGVTATSSVEDLLALDADCVIYSPLLPDVTEIVRILHSGKNVVTPLGWFFPQNLADADVIEAACQKAGVTLHGTGIHPGGITERFPLMVSGLSRSIRHVRAEEFSDIRNYKAEFVVREIMQFGKSPEEARSSPMLDLLGGGFGQSIDMVAHVLGFALDDEKRATHEMAVATRPIEAPVGTLVKGTVAAQRFTWQGTVNGEPVVTARVNWLMGQEHLEPAWSFGKERFEVEVKGEPSIALTFHGLHPADIHADLDDNPGLTATAMHCVSSVPYVCAAPPGIRTYLDLPLIAGRADPAYARVKA